MTEEDAEFNRIEREAAMRKAAVSATVQKPMHPEIKKMYEDYFDRCFRESAAIERQWDRCFRESAAIERQWVGLTPHERMMCRSYDIDTTIDKTEAKLREKNT